MDLPMSHGDLEKQLPTKFVFCSPSHHLKNPTSQTVFLAATVSVYDMHSNVISHRRLVPQNVLFSKKIIFPGESLTDYVSDLRAICVNSIHRIPVLIDQFLI